MEPLNALPKYNLFGLDEIGYDKAKVVVLPIPYDSTLTYRTGARNGPKAIIDASRNLELYSYELGEDISKMGIYTTDEIAPNLGSPEKTVEEIKKEVGIVLDDGKLPLILGGEHTVSIGAVQAFKDRGEEISIIHFDAHSDSRDELYGSKYMHATVMARIFEMYDKSVSVGVRSIDSDSAKKFSKKIIFMDEVHRQGIEKTAKKIIDATGKEVYITIDLDVLDPSEMPSVGTPEPDGLHYAELVEMLKAILGMKRLRGFDIVELNPIPYFSAPDFLAAKLAYLTLGFAKGKSKL